METLIQTLIQAGLLSDTQAQVVRYDRELHPEMSLGEILALRGWAVEETIDFFELLWEMRHTQPERKNIGQYLLEAHLIDEEQLEDILAAQKHDAWGRSLRFGEIAVLKGYVNQHTIHFFIEHLFPDQLYATNKTPFARTSLTSRPTKKPTPPRNTATSKETLPQKPPKQAPPKPSKKLLNRQAAKKTNPQLNPPKKPAFNPEEAFATSFDLIKAEDFDPKQL
ncbi:MULTISPECIES: hypothetical protein [Cyanophyceae]|uniref:hypothetical protein n=1 Tax=Cyanophyceae TaxID=3028117 RepID=UPI0007458787|nr:MULTISPECIES: hypothetical protein [Cyanophyceae]AMA10065.1 hypothetical protein AWQ23_12480 [Picosynechococcus sp. PCC 73109]